MIVLLLLICVLGINAQQNPDSIHSRFSINCKTCHTCDVPTKDESCLVICPREKIVTVHQKPEHTSELIVIDQISGKYSPVYFSHKIHAQMSVMSGGCENCHHYNTSGPILQCKSCHEFSRQREEVGIPDLKSAYHRQCMECHREWNKETGCNSCHVPINKVKDLHKEEVKKKLTGKVHPSVTEPTKIVYETNYEKGKFVTYYHDAHVKNFKLNCINCHAQESCTKCHYVNNAARDKIKSVKENKSLEEHHKKCFSCHEKDDCAKCHLDKQREPFNHEKRTGWALNKHHIKLSCIECHGSKQPYKKLDKQCVSCHKDFNKENFKHSVTGLRLTEPHLELSCEDCHAGNDYSVKPGCNSCHENFLYPKQKPGIFVNN